MHKMFIMYILYSYAEESEKKLRFFRHKERETQFFSADCSTIVSSQLTEPNQRVHAPRSPQTGLASPKYEKSTRFV